jgi:hypothetical protein
MVMRANIHKPQGKDGKAAGAVEADHLTTMMMIIKRVPAGDVHRVMKMTTKAEAGLEMKKGMLKLRGKAGSTGVAEEDGLRVMRMITKQVHADVAHHRVRTMMTITKEVLQAAAGLLGMTMMKVEDGLATKKDILRRQEKAGNTGVAEEDAHPAMMKMMITKGAR